MTSFEDIMIAELTDCEKFTRKHLLNMFEKYNYIWIAFKVNEFTLKYGDRPRFNVLTKHERSLINNEIETEISNQMRNNKLIHSREATAIVLQRNRQNMKPYFIPIYNLKKALPSEENKIHYECECGSNVSISNKSHHLKTVKHLNFVNQTPLKLKAETIVECGCGKSFSLKNKSHHNKTQYHLDWLSIDHDFV